MRYANVLLMALTLSVVQGAHAEEMGPPAPPPPRSVDDFRVDCGQVTRGNSQAYNRCIQGNAQCIDTTDSEVALSRCQDAVLANTRQLIESPNSQAMGTSAAPANASALVEKCKQDTDKAFKFCTDPVKYSTDEGMSSQTAGMAVQLGSMGASLFAGGGNNINAMCNMMLGSGAGMAGLNGAFAARCDSLIDTCEASCKGAKSALSGSYDSTSITAVNDTLGLCNAQQRKVAQMGSQAAAQANGAMMGKLCADMSKANTESLAGNQPPPYVPTGTDCSNPANASNPLCRPINAPPPGGGGFTAPNTGATGDGSDEFNVGDVDSGLTQDTKFDPNTFGKAEGPGIPNGGGGMPGGGSGDFGGDEKGKPGQGAGHNTNVLGGERGGGGYSVSPGGVNSGGGWGGYGGGTEDRKGSGFDLSKYLPGQKNGPARGPAGLGRGAGEIAPPHENIFKKISDRVQVVCKTNRLMDCH